MSQGFQQFPVRVWLGYALPQFRSDAGRPAFYKKLGSIFIPATVQMMQPWGLTAYLPTVLPSHAASNANIPDEIALVFYESCEAYEQAAHASVAGRAYEALHATVFNFDEASAIPASRSGFPVLFGEERLMAKPEGYYSLFEAQVNWQQGNTVVLVCTTENGELPLKALAAKLGNLQSKPPKGLDGLMLATAKDVIVLWAHWSREPENMNLLDGIPALQQVLSTRAQPAFVPMPDTVSFPGVEVGAGYSATFQFSRAGESENREKEVIR